jgi:hypothetical protein
MAQSSERAPRQSSGDKGLTRRQFMNRLVGGAVVIGGSAGASAIVKSAWESYENGKGRSFTENLFENDGLYNWHKLNIVPMLLQVDSSANVASSMFGSANAPMQSPPDGFIIVVQPIAVKNTLLRNVADYDEHTQSEVVRALPSIPSGLLAFYSPVGNLVYLDADKNDGLIVPITPGVITGNRLEVTNVDITGREVRGDIVYPYTSTLSVEPANHNPNGSKTKAVETYQFIGQSLAVENSAELNYVAEDYYYYNVNPIAFPAP